MAMIRWKPFGEIDRLFEELSAVQSKTGRDLAADVYEDDGNIIVEIHVAGIDPDKVDIVVEGDHLKVSGTREEAKEFGDRDYYAKEIRRGSFERIIHLPAPVSKEKTRAEIDEGVLKITLPKLNQKESHKVKVEKH